MGGSYCRSRTSATDETLFRWGPGYLPEGGARGHVRLPAPPQLPPTSRPSRVSAVSLQSKPPVRREIFHVDWPLFGELSRALALKVSRSFDPQVVVGIATAGVVPAAVVAAMLDRPFRSMIVSRRYRAESIRDTPAVFGEAPAEVRGARVLLVDETCGSGETLRLAVAAILNAGASDIRTAVSIRTGDYEPDFSALETPSDVVLPWDREVIQNGKLVMNLKYD